MNYSIFVLGRAESLNLAAMNNAAPCPYGPWRIKERTQSGSERMRNLPSHLTENSLFVACINRKEDILH